MNNLDKILDRIEEEAIREINSINAERDKQLALIQEETDNKIKDINLRAEKTALKEYESVISRAESSGAMTSREIILAAKARLIEKVYSQAEEFIYSLPEEKYVLVLSRLLANAVIERTERIHEITDKYGDEEFSDESKVAFEAVLSPEDSKKYGRDVVSKAEQYIANRDMIVPKIKLSKENAPIKGGLIIKYGNAQTNCSISDMISSLKDKTDSKIARVLFT